MQHTDSGYGKKHDWSRAEKLKPGTAIVVTLWNGRMIHGGVAEVGPAILQIDTADPDIGVGSLEEFGRADIRKIVRVRMPNLPNPEHWMLVGTIAGTAVGLTAGAIQDLSHHENYNWFLGSLGGAGVGFFGSCAALAGAGFVDLFRSHDKLVYEDLRPVNSPAG